MGLWLAKAPLVLASRSESRRAILSGAAIAAEILPADVDERAIEASAPDKSPSAVAALLARAKAAAVAARLRGRLVLGADQTLALGTERFSKPANAAAAREQLKALRGATHSLHSAIALVRDGTAVFEHCAVAHLTMRNFSDHFLDAYLAAAGPSVMASVGAYQVEGAGIQLFERIVGDHFTILGLPLLPLLAHLRAMGLLAD
jgi:septum formation protein